MSKIFQEEFRQVTVVIPTYDRPEYIRRNLVYLSKMFPLPDLRVIIVDSSPNKAEEVAEIVASYPVEYFKFDPEILFAEKLLRGFQKVKTPCTVILADDDLLIPEGLSASVAFLLKNPDYSTASGAYASMRIKDDGEIRFKPTFTQMRSLEEQSPLTRLYQFFNHYGPLYYAVHRTSIIRNIYEEAVNYSLQANPSHRQLHEELMIDTLKVIHGKYKKLPVYYYIREVAQSLPSCRDALPPARFLTSEYFSSEYSYYRDTLKRHLQQVMQITGQDQELEEIIDLLYGTFINVDMTPERRLSQYRQNTSFQMDFDKVKDRSLNYYLSKCKTRFLHSIKVNRVLREIESIEKLPAVLLLREYLQNKSQIVGAQN